MRYHTGLISLDQLVEQAAALDAANKVYVSGDDERAQLMRAGRHDVGPLDSSYRKAKDSDQKRQIRETVFARVSMSPMQRTKVNSFAPDGRKPALAWLTTRQRLEVERLAASP